MAKHVPKFKAKPDDEDKYINILLLGENGSGKSTFINSFVNFLQFSSLAEAEKCLKMTSIILTKLSILTDDGKTKVVNFGEDSNKEDNLADSSNQAIKTYVFSFANKMIRLIDTPGINGPWEATTKDRENFENILDYVSQFKHLHAVCFVFKPDVTVLGAGFKYYLVELISRLDRSVATNMAFIFTRPQSKATDTINRVRLVLGEIEESEGVVIPLRYRNSSGQNCFYFDNEAFNCLVARGAGVETANAACLERNCKVCYESSRALIHYIVGDKIQAPLPPYIVQDTASVNEARRLIFDLTRPLANIMELVQDNLDTLRRHQSEMVNKNRTAGKVNAKLYVPVVDLVTTVLKQPMTVCAATKCAKVYTVSGLKKYQYEQRCHNPCYLHDVQKGLVGDHELIHCAAMGGTRKCKQCMCDLSNHMHVYYAIKVVESKMETLHPMQIVRSRHDCILKLEQRVKLYQIEHKIISSGLATFAYFLKHNSICPIKDAYESYLDYVIQREKISIGSNKDILQGYKSLKLEHIEQKRILEEAGRVARMRKIIYVTSEQIVNTVMRLKKLPLMGRKIAELHNFVVGGKRTEMLKNMEYVQMEAARKPKLRDANSVGDAVHVAANYSGEKDKRVQVDTQKGLMDLISISDLGALKTCIDELEKKEMEEATTKQQLEASSSIMKEVSNNQTEQQNANVRGLHTTGTTSNNPRPVCSHLTTDDQEDDKESEDENSAGVVGMRHSFMEESGPKPTKKLAENVEKVMTESERFMIFEMMLPLIDVAELMVTNLDLHHIEVKAGGVKSTKKEKTQLLLGQVLLVTGLELIPLEDAVATCLKCLIDCSLLNVQEKHTSHDQLKWKIRDTCKNCHCESTNHLLKYYRTRKVDISTKRKIVPYQDYADEYRLIISCLATFAYFFQNSSKVIADVYDVYLTTRIAREVNAKDTNHAYVRRYKASLEAYRNEKKRIAANNAHLSVKQICSYIQDLAAMPLTGQTIANLFSFQWRRQQEEIPREVGDQEVEHLSASSGASSEPEPVITPEDSKFPLTTALVPNAVDKKKQFAIKLIQENNFEGALKAIMDLKDGYDYSKIGPIQDATIDNVSLNNGKVEVLVQPTNTESSSIVDNTDGMETLQMPETPDRINASSRRPPQGPTQKCFNRGGYSPPCNSRACSQPVIQRSGIPNNTRTGTYCGIQGINPNIDAMRSGEYGNNLGLSSRQSDGQSSYLGYTHIYDPVVATRVEAFRAQAVAKLEWLKYQKLKGKGQNRNKKGRLNLPQEYK